MTVQGVGNCAGIRVVLADHRLASALVSVTVRNSEGQDLDFYHHQRLYQVTIHRVSHPSPSRLDFQTAPPPGMVGIHFVLQIRHSVFAKKHGPPDRLARKLAHFGDKAKLNEPMPVDAKNLVTRQTLLERSCADGRLCFTEDFDDLRAKYGRRQRSSGENETEESACARRCDCQTAENKRFSRRAHGIG
jgi:hypothetical protein